MIVIWKQYRGLGVINWLRHAATITCAMFALISLRWFNTYNLYSSTHLVVYYDDHLPYKYQSSFFLIFTQESIRVRLIVTSINNTWTCFVMPFSYCSNTPRGAKQWSFLMSISGPVQCKTTLTALYISRIWITVRMATKLYMPFYFINVSKKGSHLPYAFFGMH